MKRIILLSMCSFVAVGSASAAAFFSGSVQGQVNTWASIWTNITQTTAIAPTAGNTYELVANAVPFGASATGASINNTRLRNPYGTGAVGGVQTFPGDSLTLGPNTEIRFKNDNISLTSVNFPGVAGNPGLILNGGALNAGNDFVFRVDGSIQVTAPSLICPADNGAGRVLEPRAIHLAGALSGSGSLLIIQAGTTIPQEVSGVGNTFSGDWIVKAGWLRGSGAGSLGTGNIIVDPLASVPITTASVLSNGPAQVELMYDIGTTANLTLANGGRMLLHQHCVFGSVTIEGNALPVGTHTYAELRAAYPNNFPAGGSGSISVGRVVTVNTVNNVSPGPGETSLFQALSGLQAGDVVRFNIPGAGPHVIQTPLGGYPLITANDVTIDGYSQPGSVPNSNPILGGNNAQLKIVLDSTGADAGGSPPLWQRRSTRLPFSGYGDSENGILGVHGADQFVIRGISFLGRVTFNSDDDPKIYCIALVQEAINARVQGCWFGLPPGGSTQNDVKGCGSAVAGFRFNTGAGFIYSEGLVYGTDGDGANDVQEFNVSMGMNITLGLELPNVKIAGNYFNVFPNGNTFLDTDAWFAHQLAASDGDSDTLENIENGRFANNMTVGTDGDGVSDANERNIFNHAIYDHQIEVYTAGTNVVLAGNYFGVGVDGLTPAPLSTNNEPDVIELPGLSSIRVGSNGDGVSDDLEGNLLVNIPGDIFVNAGSGVPIVARRNTMKNNSYLGVPFANGQSGRLFSSYYSGVVFDTSMVIPVLNAISNNLLLGSMVGPGGEYIAAFVDVYLLDPAALAKTNLWPAPIVHPTGWLGTFIDNGTNDLDPAADRFAFDLSSFGLSDSTYVTVAVTYSKDAAISNAGRAITGPPAYPISRLPKLEIHIRDRTVELSWLGKDGAFILQQNSGFAPGEWIEPFDTTLSYASGRNFATMPFDDFAAFLVHRLISR
jgi:hypothetical protein